MKSARVAIAAFIVFLGSLGLAAPSWAAADNTVALYTMNEPAGSSVLLDSSGNGLHGSIGHEVTTGATYDGATGHRFHYLTPNTPPAHPGHINTVPHDSALNPGTDDFAVTVRLRTTQRFGNIIQKGQSATPGGYFKFENPNGIVTCLYRGQDGQRGVSSNGPLRDGQWHTIRCERTDRHVTMYVDGVRHDRRWGPTGSIANNWPLAIAGKYDCNQRSITCDYFVGDIDYVHIESENSSNPDTQAPSAPGRPDVVSEAPGEAEISWAAASDNRAETLVYSIYRNDSSSSIGQVTGPTSGTMSFTDDGLTPGEAHRYRVRASDGPNTGSYSPWSEWVEITGGGGGGGSDVLAEDDFSDGLGDWTVVRGPWSIDQNTGSPSDGPPSLTAEPQGQNASGRLPFSDSSDEVCAEVDFRATSVVGSKYSLLKLRNDQGQSVARIRVSPSGRVSGRADIAKQSLSTSATVSPGTWHRLGLCVEVDGSSGAIAVSVDGDTVGSWTRNTGTAPVALVQLGDNSSRTATVHFDDLVVTDEG